MEVKSDKIEKLEDLVTQYIDKDKKIKKSEIKRLTAPGENFGSLMLKVDLLLQDNHGETEPLSIVAKLIPDTEFFQKIFNVQVTFKLEAAFYDIIVPTLQQFQRDQGIQNVITFFPKFYGSRKNLNGGDNVDGNAVLLLENLTVSGKGIINPKNMYKETKLIITIILFKSKKANKTRENKEVGRKMAKLCGLVVCFSKFIDI